MFGLLSSRQSRQERDTRERLNRYEQELSKRGARALRQYEEELGTRGNRARSRLRELGSGAHGRWDEARERLSTESQRALGFSEDSAREFDRHVHSNVWSYIGISAAVGVTVGLLLGRRF